MRPTWAAFPLPVAPLDVALLDVALLDGPGSWWWAGVAVVLAGVAAVVWGVWAWRSGRRGPLAPIEDADWDVPPIDIARSDALPLLLFPDERERPDGGSDRLGVAVAAVALLAAAGYAAAPLLSRALAPPAPARLYVAVRPFPKVAEASAVVGGAGGVEGVGEDATSVRGVSVADYPSAVDPATGDRLILWAGDGQLARPGNQLRRGLAVVLQDSAGRPLPGREVTFTVAGGGGRVDPPRGRTTELGLALARWWPGSDPDSLSVTAAVAERPALSLRFRAHLAPEALAGAAMATPESSPGTGPAADPGSTSVADSGSPTEGGSAPVDTAAGGERASRPPPAVAAPRPVAMSRPGAPLAAGGVHTCWLEAPEGRPDPPDVWCRGGPGSRVSLPRPAGDGAGSIRGLAAGIFRLCAMAGNTVACWSLSPESRSAAPPVAVRVPGEAGVVDLAVGSEHACALGGDGVVRCWGTNTRGQLGDGTSTDAAAPVEVAGLPRVVQLVGGWLHGCALAATGRAYCWGANGTGQLGDGTTVDRPRAVPVRHDPPLALLAAGSGHTCGLTPAGAAWCWGDNAHGQLGTEARGVTTRPVAVDTRLRFRTLVAGSVHTCGLTGDGRAWCWGRNTFGQLGDGSTVDSPIPAAVAGDLRFTTLTAGGAHTCGATAVGDLYCWGNNTHGQLGDGTRDHRTNPTRVSR